MGVLLLKRETGYWWEVSKLSGVHNMGGKAEENNLETSKRRPALSGGRVHRKQAL